MTINEPQSILKKEWFEVETDPFKILLYYIDNLDGIGNLHIEKNPHRGVYESVEQYFKNRFEDDWKELPEEVKKRMVERDIIWEIQLYPRTPVSSYMVFSDTLEDAAKEMLEALGYPI